MRSLSILILGALLATPLALAGPITDGCYASAVCILEYDNVDGSCDEGFASGGTSVSVGGDITARGFYECYGSGGYGGGNSGVSITTPVGSVYWIEFYYVDFENGEFHGCYLDVAGVSGPTCPAPPPNPGWGHVLP